MLRRRWRTRRRMQANPIPQTCEFAYKLHFISEYKEIGGQPRVLTRRCAVKVLILLLTSPERGHKWTASFCCCQFSNPDLSTESITLITRPLCPSKQM